jgi:Bacterial PH domain
LETGQVYKATLDKQANWGLKWGTYPTMIGIAGILLILAIVNILSGKTYGWYFLIFISAIIFIAMLVYYLTMSVRGYILYKDKLLIKRILAGSNVEINLSDIEKVERFPEEEFYKSRRVGKYSMFGYYCDLHHPTLGYYKIYATNLSNLIMIEMKDSKKIVISPDDVGLVDALNKNI